MRLELVARHRLEHRVDVLDEVERLGVEEHVLLLDAERVRLALAELVVEHAAAGGEALAGDRGGIDLLHGVEYGLRFDFNQPARIEEVA